MNRSLLFLLLALSGCAGGAVNVVAPNSKVPVSMSRGVRDQDGDLVTPERKQRVGVYQTKFTGYSLFYSLLPLTPKKDISESINAQVAQAGGDAVVNLRVIGRGCGLNYVVIFNILPIWPGCTRVQVEGDIIKVLPKTEAAPVTGYPSGVPAGPAASPEATPAGGATPPKP
jgi:hypothetical protein